jgi:protein-tyrosine phosphatase
LGKIYWIEGPWPGRLAIVERPPGGAEAAEDIAALGRAGIDVLVSLLSPEETAGLGLADEARLCDDEGIAFLTLPVVNLSVPPSENELRRLAESLEERLRQGESVGVHCRFSVGRSGLLASALLIGAGIEPDSAFELVSTARGEEIPQTEEQLAWLVDYARQVR